MMKSKKFKWWYILIAVLILGVIGSIASGGKEKPSDAQQAQNTPTPPPAIQPSTPAEQPNGETSIPDIPDSSETLGQQNALKSAENYLSIAAFSHDSLVSQLEYEKYTNEEAVYAADHCGADWNEQAVKSAQNYLGIAPFSHSGVIRQLEYEKFTSEQATYGADNCGADWSEQAVRSAKNYLDMTDFSKDGLINQLEYEGFTHEQAVHGVEANGY